jgi:hypothetical protein
MYDLSRTTPHQAVIGIGSLVTGKHIKLEDADLLRVLKGREQTSRFLSMFIITELEGRQPSQSCLRSKDVLSIHKTCRVAFEVITFELLRDIGGIISNLTSDPLYAMSEAEQMQIRDDPLGSEVSPMKTCEPCRSEFGMAVDAAKEEFWRMLPKWFDIEVSTWG